MAPTPGQDPQGYPKLDTKAARALAPHLFNIKIDSILGGHSPSTHFAAKDQFRTSLGIDPGQPISDTISATSVGSSGLLRPAPSSLLTSVTGLGNLPTFIIGQPKGGAPPIFVYDYSGSVYTVASALSTAGVTALSDAGEMGNGSANGLGAAYYDNYMYFAKSGDIARYGPLDGTPKFNGSYWTGTLGKGVLNVTGATYPWITTLLTAGNYIYPLHPMHRHSDGKLYFGDVQNGQGMLHVISTSKTTVEGDTDNGSTFQKLSFGYGLFPIAIETYGSMLAIALIETGSSGVRPSTAKIAFWDTTSQNFNSIVWVEFPDVLIGAMKNVNGALYVFSGPYLVSGATGIGGGFRVTRFVGGYSFQEVLYYEDGSVPPQGAVDGAGDRLIFGATTVSPEASASIISIGGLQKSGLSKGTFNIMRSTATGSPLAVTAVLLWDKDAVSSGQVGLSKSVPIIGWSKGSTGSSNNGIDYQGLGYSSAPSVWWSQTYKIGQPFKITKIRLPLAQTMAANMTVTAKVYTDDGSGTTYTLQTINNTNYPNKKNIVFRSDSAGGPITGDHNFWIELRWTGSALCTVGLPISIEGEHLDD